METAVGEERMRLYVWPGLDCVGSYTPGMAYSLAESKEQAIDLICAKREDPKAINQEFARELVATMRSELESTAPIVYDEPMGEFEWGSD